MSRLYRYLAIILINLISISCPRASDDVNQIVLVLADSWQGIDGKLYRLEKLGKSWQILDAPIQVVIGKGGIAWANKALQEKYSNGPLKKEGDNKTPAGIFNLVYAMGYQAETDKNSAFNYRKIEATSLCIDDPESTFYTQIVDSRYARINSQQWKSSETLKRQDSLYKWLIVVDYNMSKPIPGAGSCIFMHVWRNKHAGTAGCVAMSEQHIVNLIQWLDSKKSPKLIILPKNLYASYRQELGLPDLMAPVSAL